MAPAVQVALFLACVVIILLGISMMVVAIGAGRKLKELMDTVDHVKSDVEVLVQHSHDLISKVTEVSARVSDQIDEVEVVVHTVREWTERADRVVDSVGSVIEPPIFSTVRHLNVLRKGVATFFQALFHLDKHNNQHTANIEQEREEGHV